MALRTDPSKPRRNYALPVAPLRLAAITLALFVLTTLVACETPSDREGESTSQGTDGERAETIFRSGVAKGVVVGHEDAQVVVDYGGEFLALASLALR